MANISKQKFIDGWEARSRSERGILLFVCVLVLAYLWFMFVYESISADKISMRRDLQLVQSEISSEELRYQEIQATYTSDPDAFARDRIAELEGRHEDIDAQLDELYGELIPPREMAQVLISMLQRETSLQLVGLENLKPEELISTTITREPVTNLVAENSSDNSIDLQVYKHGLKMKFEGDYLETIRYLRSLEALDSSVFWEVLSFEVQEYPRSSITLNIFTLSTQEEWIGV